MDMGKDGKGGRLDVRETEVGEFFTECLDEFGADLVLFVVVFEVVTFGDAGVTADGRDVDHAVPLEVWRVSIGTCDSTEHLPHPPPLAGMLAQQFPTPHHQLNSTAKTGLSQSIPELHKRPRLNRTLNIRNISQTKIHQFLILLLPQPANEAITRQRLPQSNSRQAIFREAEIEKPRDGDGGCAELFLLFDEIGAANETYCAFMPEGGEELKHFGGDGLGGLFSISWKLDMGFLGHIYTACWG